MTSEIKDKIDEVFRKNNIRFKELAVWWVETYPDDIFVKHWVGKITKIFKENLLEK